MALKTCPKNPKKSWRVQRTLRIGIGPIVCEKRADFNFRWPRGTYFHIRIFFSYNPEVLLGSGSIRNGVLMFFSCLFSWQQEKKCFLFFSVFWNHLQQSYFTLFTACDLPRSYRPFPWLVGHFHLAIVASRIPPTIQFLYCSFLVDKFLIFIIELKLWVNHVF